MDIQESIMKVKDEVLNHPVLTTLDIQMLEKRFNGKVHCDEYHQHSYKCVYHQSVESAVIERLLDEIKHHRKSMKRMQDEMMKFINPELDEDD